ncbi:hypothetical protein [Nocardia sp. NPDC052566]|uniref:hypothetical protein n=1 Tax=Nocardia sp. NPDC052566 TaxID=3364330 RepID=UPI0037CC2374
MADLLAELDITMSRSDVMGTRSGGRAPRGSRASIMPFHQGAADARALLVRVLDRLSTQVAAALDEPKPADSAAQAAFLSTHAPRLDADSRALTGMGDLTRAVRTAHLAIDAPPQQRVIGRCPCGTTLYADADTDIVECDRCARVHSVAILRSTSLQRVCEEFATAAQLVQILSRITEIPVTSSRVRQWASRGKIAGHRRNGQTVYRVGDVLALVCGHVQG